MIRRFRVTSIAAIFIAVCAFIFGNVSARNIPVKKLLFETIGINDGLSQGMVTWIMQDHYGFLWFATKDGLNRYDGYHFVVYRHDPSDPYSIADNYTETIFEDSKGRLWVGTTSQGLELFDRETEKFQHFKDLPNNVHLGRVAFITEDKLGRIWVTLQQGVVLITEHTDAKGRSTFTFQNFTENEAHVFVARDGTIWISEAKAGLLRIRFEHGKEYIDSIPAEKYAWFPETNKRDEFYVLAFVEDTIGHKIYLFNSNSISIFDENRNSFSIIHSSEKRDGFHFTVSIHERTIWLISTFHVEVFDMQKEQFTRIQSTDPRLDPLTKNATIVYMDRTGIIWIGTTGYGVLKYNPRAEKFHRTDEQSIHWMQQRNDGQVMLIKEGSRIYLFNKDLDTYTGTLPDIITEKKPAYSDGTTEAIIQDNDSTYWICKQTLITYDPSSMAFTRYRDKPSFPICKDHSGDIWFGSENSFCRYDKKTRKFFAYPFPVEVPVYPYKSVQAIYQDAGENFWLGTTGGLFCFNPVNHQWKHFKNDPSDSTSLSFNLIFSLCPDPLQPNRYLWIGTNGGGLNCFNMQTGKSIRYSTKNGLANGVVYGILSDNTGNLWMSTNNGLSRLDKTRKSFRNYNVNDGLQGNEFNRNAFCKTTDGILFFGGVNGFNYFDPAELNDSTVVPNIIITDFKISNQPVSFQSKNSSLSKPVYLTNKITLPYRENMISFDFVSFDFTNADKNLYQYKLEGFDKAWIQSGTQHSATYTNLNPGTYTFYVKGSNSDGIWNEVGTSIQLRILPPWYMTWWFRTIVIIVIFSAGYSFYRYRLSHALKLQAVRNRIASDLHDEIGSTLSSISIYSNVVQKRTKDAVPEVITYLQRINNNISNVMESMSDIVWAINAHNDRFENIFIRMRETAAEILEAKQYALHFSFDENLNNEKLNMEERKHFYLLFKEAVNNIAKYAEGKNVWIILAKRDNAVEMTIKDDGRGFVTGVRKGNGMHTMHERAKKLRGNLTITSFPEEGTSVQLIF